MTAPTSAWPAAPGPVGHASIAASKWTIDCPETHSLPVGDSGVHLVPGGFTAVWPPGGRVEVETTVEQRRAQPTLACPCWPSVWSWRAGNVVGRTVHHHRFDSAEDQDEAS